MGSSIGIEGDKNAGTLGGFVILTHGDIVRRDFLTNYHVVRPSQSQRPSESNDFLQSLDRFGSSPMRLLANRITMESPSGLDKDATATHISERLEAMREHETELNATLCRVAPWLVAMRLNVSAGGPLEVIWRRADVKSGLVRVRSKNGRSPNRTITCPRAGTYLTSLSLLNLALFTLSSQPSLFTCFSSPVDYLIFSQLSQPFYLLLISSRLSHLQSTISSSVNYPNLFTYFSSLLNYPNLFTYFSS